MKGLWRIRYYRDLLIDRLREQKLRKSERKASPPPLDYDKAWTGYSARWDRKVRKSGHRYLGDEWGTPALTKKIVGDFVSPYLRPGDEVLEIGCGGGKYSEILASRDIRLVCGDVSRHMLERTKKRLSGRTSVRFVKLNGYNLNRFSDAAFDLVFSFDVFVHLDIEDTFSYLGEIRRTLKPGGYGVLHFANLISEDGWKKFETEFVFNIGGHKHFDRFRFLTWEIVEKMVTHFDFRILDSWKEPWRDILVVFQKP